MKLDAIDKCILEALQKDAKINIKVLADELNMSRTPVYERIRRLENEGVIGKYVAILNKDHLEKSMVVFCFVSLDNQRLDNIRKFSQAISGLPEVLECYLLGGQNDFLLKVVVEDLNAYHKFSAGTLATLPNVSQIKSTFVLNETKHSTVFPI